MDRCAGTAIGSSRPHAPRELVRSSNATMNLKTSSKAPPFEHRTKAHLIFENLKQRILDGDLPPGTRLLRKTVAEEFDSSEIPVREAFRSLEARGFVRMIAHGGAFVTELEVEELLELLQVRSLLEPEANVLSAPFLTVQDVAELRGLNEKIADRITKKSPSNYFDLNRRFHEVILSRCENSKLSQMISDLRDLSERSSQVYTLGTEFLAIAVSDHDEMIRLIERQDLEELRKVGQRHAEMTLQAVRQVLAPVRPPIQRPGAKASA